MKSREINAKAQDARMQQKEVNKTREGIIMAMTLASDEYDEVRLLIGSDIDEDDLPDRQIDAGTRVLGAAESYVLSTDTGGT